LSLFNYFLARLTDNGLKLGDLKGNRFTIVLRQVSADDEHLKTAIESLNTHGFINYYGLQRFGTSDIPTHKIGL
jgi:tRNA pseudouridine13 synthase